MIMKCTNNFVHAFQDKQYGKGNRVFNPMKKTDTQQKARCTVCLSEQSAK